MIRNPYKFLDHYTKADRDIFFGRDREVEEIYSRLFQGRLLVIYGPSGTGKTSLLQCGVANKIPDTDWMPVFIRRHENMLASVDQALARHAKKPFKAGFDTGEKLNSLYLDYLMPVYLVFDQLEELFIFGSSEEKAGFRDLLAGLMQDSDSNYRVILVIREEYFADLSYLEDALPEIFENRFRVERMSKAQLAEPINGPAQVAGIRLEEGLATRIADKLLDEKGNIELTYLQVLMDRLFRLAARRNPSDVHITHADLDSFGKLGNLLAGYLDEQLSLMDNKALGEQVLKTLVSIDGTRRPMRLADIKNHIRQFGKGGAINDEALQNTIQYFVSARILQDKDENGFYELKHDSLAARIYDKISAEEMELMQLRHFVQHALLNYQNRDILLTKDDLAYIQKKEHLLQLDPQETAFIEKSRQNIRAKRRTVRRLTVASAVALLLLLMSIGKHVFDNIRQHDSIVWAHRSISQYQNIDQRLAAAYRAYNAYETPNAREALIRSFNALLDEPTGNHALDSLRNVYLRTFEPAPDSILHASLMNAHGYIFAHTANDVLIWDEEGTIIRQFPHGKRGVLNAKVSEGSELIALLGEDAVLSVFDRHGALLFEQMIHHTQLNPRQAFDFIDETRIIINNENDIVLIDVIDGREIQRLNEQNGVVHAVALSGDRRFIAAASHDTIARTTIWYYNRVREQYNFYSQGDYHNLMDTVWSVNFSSNGKNIILGGVRSENRHYGIRSRNINMDESTPIYGRYFYVTFSYVELLNNDMTIRVVHYIYDNNSPIFLMAGSFFFENKKGITRPRVGREIHHLSFSADNRFFAHSDGHNIYLSDGRTEYWPHGNHLLCNSGGQSSLFSENTSYWYVVNGKQINVLFVDFVSIAETVGMSLDTNRLLRAW